MHWNYRVVKTPTDTCESYGIHEVYYDADDRPVYYTENPVPCFAWSHESLGAEIERFRTALSKPILTPEDFVKLHDTDPAPDNREDSSDPPL